MKRIIIIILCLICCVPVKTVYGAGTLYPIEIWENRQDGKKEVVKTYELSDEESPDDIPKDSFEWSGWRYELADIIKKEIPNTEVKEEAQVLELESKTNEMETVLKLLPNSVDYETEDGYIGILSLDTDSIIIENAGTVKSSYTVTEKKEYQNLSANDTSLLPKTIIVDGRALTLSSVTWNPSSQTIDGSKIPVSYNATAVYTGVASKTSVSGYLVKAEYKGSVSRTTKGKTLYTAYFIGTKLLEPTAVPTPALKEPMEVDSKQSRFDYKNLIIIGLAATLLFGGFIFYKEKRKGVSKS